MSVWIIAGVVLFALVAVVAVEIIAAAKEDRIEARRKPARDRWIVVFNSLNALANENAKLRKRVEALEVADTMNVAAFNGARAEIAAVHELAAFAANKTDDLAERVAKYIVTGERSESERT